jgi:hypothetical protein
MTTHTTMTMSSMAGIMTSMAMSASTTRSTATTIITAWGDLQTAPPGRHSMPFIPGHGSGERKRNDHSSR